jgi:phage shock protein PspC (stress-responsive transcriptional regulator)
MTTSDTLDDMTPPAPTARPRRLRRVHEGRVGAGVAAGLGEYFGLDPVLFRVLFATSAFFGGAGIIAYLLAWAAIPDEGTEHAAVDGWFDELRRRRVPLWVVAGGAGLLIWLVAFSWWAPGPFLPVLAIIVVILFFVARRNPGNVPWAAPAPPAPVDLRKHPAAPVTDTSAADEPSAPVPPGGAALPPTPPPLPSWMGDGRSWFDDARAAGRARRRRAQPVRIAVLSTLLATLVALGIADAMTRIPMQAYFWSGLVITVVGLLVGLILRRAPISLGVLAIPFAIGTIAFAGSSASFSDGAGQQQWMPAGAPAADYRLAFGQGVLDLRSMPTNKTEHIDVTMGAGRALIILPKTMDATVHANVHFGHITADDGSGDIHDGVNVKHTVTPLAGAKGQPVTVDVHVADGEITVDRR